jgi:CheY-like chemotaxis protein/nitrogen-specific signal transduction histidine kinase
MPEAGGLQGMPFAYCSRLDRDLTYRQACLEGYAHVSGRLGHDFANILTSILGFTELTLNLVTQASPAHAYLLEIQQAARHGTQMTMLLRWFSRRGPVRVLPCSLAKVLAEEEARLRPTLAPGVRIELETGTDLPWVGVSEEPLHLLIEQLLANACEAVGAQGRLRLATCAVQLTQEQCRQVLGQASPGAYVELTVSDDGCGMSEETWQHLFVAPFYTTKPHHRGLGLAAVHGIVHAHCGGFRLVPGPGGRGTTCLVYLPAATRPMTSRATAETDPSRPGSKVLVVDDDPMILRLCMLALQGAGFRVQTASTGLDALRAYQNAGGERFSLVLTDLNMPHMTGVELARCLQACDANVNVLFMTGQVPPDFVETHLGSNALDLVTKPFIPEEMLGAVRRAIAREARPVLADDAN